LFGLEVAFPPSVNQWIRVVDGRPILSKKYRDGQHNAGQELLVQRPRKQARSLSLRVLEEIGPFIGARVEVRPAA
jgi:hypothetical protein